ncbi:MAG: type II secretion system F family protein [Aminipila sp.]
MDNNSVDKIIDYDNYILQGVQARNYYMVTCISLFVIGYIFYASFLIAVLMTLLAIPFKKTYIKFKIKQQREILRQQFRDLLYSLSASISAGRQMSEAIIEGNKNLALMYGEKEPIMLELQYITKGIKESRATDEMLLKDFAYRSGIEEIINFADVYSICRTTGANLGVMISKATEVIMDKMAIDREIKSITAQKKVEARIISSMPVIIIIFLNLVSPGYLDSLYYTLLGRVIMTSALFIIIISYYIMNRMVEIKV